MSVVEAVEIWLDSYAGGLAKPSLTAYRGELRRFSEHLLQVGVREVGQIMPGTWDGYLTNLVNNREHVQTRRVDSLQPSSALQAGRITRTFLRFCWHRGWIGWMPLPGGRRGVAVKPTQPAKVPPVLVELLSTSGVASNVGDARQMAVLGLAFWLGMRPHEIATATVGNIETRASTIVCHVPGRQGPSTLPTRLHELLRVYWRLRQGNSALPEPDEPLITKLKSKKPLVAVSVWRLLRSVRPASDPSKSVALGSKTIRDAFVRLSSESAANQLAAIGAQVGRSNVPIRALASEMQPDPDLAVVEARTRLVVA